LLTHNVVTQVIGVLDLFLLHAEEDEIFGTDSVGVFEGGGVSTDD
jgi:hypothetical protein